MKARAPAAVTRTPKPLPERTKSTERWKNGRWAVTDFGRESRNVINGMPMPGDFAKADLLRQRPDQPGVANAALHLATKTWVDDPDALVDALAAALAHHHPGQIVIDVEKTRDETRRVWQQSRPSPSAPGKLGHDYLEDAEERWRSYRERQQYDEE